MGIIALNSRWAGGDTSRSQALFVTWPALSLLRGSSLYLVLVRMLRWVEDVDWELQEDGSLENDRQPGVDLRRKRDENARTVEVSLVLGPLSAFLIPLLCTGTFLQCQARHKHEQ